MLGYARNRRISGKSFRKKSDTLSLFGGKTIEIIINENEQLASFEDSFI